MIPGSGGGLGTGGSSSVRRSDWLRVLPLVEILFSLPVSGSPGGRWWLRCLIADTNALAEHLL